MKKQLSTALAEVGEILSERLTYKDTEQLMLTDDHTLQNIPLRTLKKMQAYHEKVIYSAEYTEEAKTAVHGIYEEYMHGGLYTRMTAEANGIIRSWVRNVAKRTLKG